MIERAEEGCDEKLATRIRGIDLFAVKAKYHRSCRSSYVGNDSRWRSSNQEEVVEQQLLKYTHELVFKKVCESFQWR